jgi:hypothetical protein
VSRYVEVPAAPMRAMLEEAGFTPGRMGREVTYTRVHAMDPRLSVTVYTSLSVDGASVRACGTDAIRVVALFTWENRNSTPTTRRKGLFARRVYRVTSIQSVLERTLDAMREAYKACNEYRKTL